MVRQRSIGGESGFPEFVGTETAINCLLYRKWEDVGGRGGNPGLQLGLPIEPWLYKYYC